jgi:hypothetical protein
MATPSTKSATPLQVAAWKKKNGHSNITAAEALGTHPRTFARWLAGDTPSPKWLGDMFRAASK